MPPHETDRNLLFGINAVQNEFITRDELIAAMNAWVIEKHRPLGEILVERGALLPADRTLLDLLLDRHIARHGDDPAASLAALSSAGSLAEDLRKSIVTADSDLLQSIAQIPAQSQVDPYATRATIPPRPPPTGSVRFRKVREHASGNLGVVYVARDEELHRDVALKEIKEKNADHLHSQAKFLLEAEVTGGLEHPGIVPVYALGHHDDGRPFYAMRFIRGKSLLDAIRRFHADESLKNNPGRRLLALQKLIRRFTDVCNAVAYAHSRGVLHRDLKPDNVMVGKYGETLVVDWGLAKALGRSGEPTGTIADNDDPLPEASLQPSSSEEMEATQAGSLVGTPAYMSPEQAAGRLDLLGPASDIYGLGATLYHLIVGRPPISGTTLGEVLAKIQFGDFARPRTLVPWLDLALEAICLKAMALKPHDRYGSCRDLANEIERWAVDEPVLAWSEPFSRRARRWARRNRTAVTGSVVALLFGVIGLGAVADQQSRSNARLTKANLATTLALDETRRAKSATEGALAQSEESRRQAESISRFLTEVFQSPDPSQDGREVKLADVLDRAAEKLDREFDGSPVTKGSLLNTLGKTTYGLGLFDKARVLFAKAVAIREAALVLDHPDTLDSRSSCALIDFEEGRYAEAATKHKAILKLMESKIGFDHLYTLDCRGNYANDCIFLAPDRRAEGITLLESNTKLKERRLGPDHPETLESRGNLAAGYYFVGRFADAATLGEETLSLEERKLGPDHPNTLTNRSNLAAVYYALGRIADAVRMQEETLRRRESKLGPDHPNTIIARGGLALYYGGLGRHNDAATLHEATLRGYRDKVGPDHPNTMTLRDHLASDYENLGRWFDAEPLRRENVASYRKAVDMVPVVLAGYLSLLAANLLEQEKWSETETVVRECLEIRLKAIPGDKRCFNAMSLLGGALLGRRRYAEAEPHLMTGYAGIKAQDAKLDAGWIGNLRDAADRVIRLYATWGKFEKVEEWKIKLGRDELPADVFKRN